ncbi:hypothetical protein QUA24_07475 [Microcoleus sp. Pol12B5]
MQASRSFWSSRDRGTIALTVQFRLGSEVISPALDAFERDHFTAEQFTNF